MRNGRIFLSELIKDESILIHLVIDTQVETFTKFAVKSFYDENKKLNKINIFTGSNVEDEMLVYEIENNNLNPDFKLVKKEIIKLVEDKNKVEDSEDNDETIINKSNGLISVISYEDPFIILAQESASKFYF